MAKSKKAESIGTDLKVEVKAQIEATPEVKTIEVEPTKANEKLPEFLRYNLSPISISAYLVTVPNPVETLERIRIKHKLSDKMVELVKQDLGRRGHSI